MRTFWRILYRTIFWSYERGTWQYDVAVATILIFVLLTPRRWFQDQPQVGMPDASGQVEEITSDELSRTYRVDARVLAPPTRTPELANDLHNAIQRSVPELKGRGFQILRIEPVRDSSGTVIAYEVQVKR
jgi:hypothetical protein